MRTFNASLFLFAALAFTHAAALPTRYRRQGGSSSVDFICPPKDLDGVSLANSTVDGDILTCLYGKTDCSYAVDVCFLSVDGNEVVEQDGSMMSNGSMTSSAPPPPPSCPLTADPSGGSSSASATSTASASTSTSTSVNFVCPPTDLDGVSLSNSTVDGDILTCLYGKTDCSYAVDDGNEVVEQDGSMMSSAPPPSCPLNADPSSGSSSASATSTASASTSTSTSVDFVCPPTDLDGVSLANSTVDGDILTCLYGKTDCSYAVDVCFLSVDGNEVVEQNGSMMSSAPPPSCPLTADPSSGSSSGSGSSESMTDNTLTHSKHSSRCSITKHSIRGQPARNRKLGHKWDSGSGDIPLDQFVSGAPLAGGAVLRDRTLFNVSPFPPFRGAPSVNYWHKVGLNFPEMPEIDELGFAPFLSIEKNQKDPYLTLVSETASRTENGRACNVTQHEWAVDGCSEFLRGHPKCRIGNEYSQEGSLNEERAVISRNDNPLNIVVGTAFNKV
ncbi:hypothetical protein K438DRAFT_2045756 [Mycena galopus ATCC 62051]|nr:hypothetical protein K438DRAFT_2045756 [Mycena galopus ATCC 62051]